MPPAQPPPPHSQMPRVEMGEHYRDRKKPIFSEPHFTSASKIGLTVKEAIAIVAAIVAAVVGWHKLPDKSVVQGISDQATEQQQAQVRTAEVLEQRLRLLEANSERANEELIKLNRRLEFLLIVSAGTAIDEISKSKKTRDQVLRVQRNLRQGLDPFTGSTLEESLSDAVRLGTEK